MSSHVFATTYRPFDSDCCHSLVINLKRKNIKTQCNGVKYTSKNNVLKNYWDSRFQRVNQNILHSPLLLNKWNILSCYMYVECRYVFTATLAKKTFNSITTTIKLNYFLCTYHYKKKETVIIIIAITGKQMKSPFLVTLPHSL